VRRTRIPVLDTFAFGHRDRYVGAEDRFDVESKNNKSKSCDIVGRATRVRVMVDDGKRTFSGLQIRIRWKTSGRLHSCTKRARRARLSTVCKLPTALRSAGCCTRFWNLPLRFQRDLTCTVDRTRCSGSGMISDKPAQGRWKQT